MLQYCVHFYLLPSEGSPGKQVTRMMRGQRPRLLSGNEKPKDAWSRRKDWCREA